MNIGILKEANRSIREACALRFRREAMGGGDDQDLVHELEIKLRNSIAEKYKQVKSDFTRFAQMKAKRYLDEMTKTVRRNIQTADYERLE